MCYSAQIKADYHHFVREHGAEISLKRFSELFWEKRQDGGWSKIPKAMRDAFRRPRGEDEFELAKLVAEADRERAATYEAELSAQTARLAKAEMVLAGAKPTKKAADDQRIATHKIKAAQRNLDELQRKQPADRDSRIYPGQYALVMIENDGQRIVVPMRYQCRLPDWSDATERKLLGIRADEEVKLYRAAGCDLCHHQGYKGRVAIMELLKMDSDLDDLVARRASIRDLKEAAQDKGFRPLASDGLQRVVQGITSLSEVARVVDLTDRMN